MASGDPFVVITCYNEFESLAHKPKGSPASQSVFVYHLDRKDGTMTLLTVDNQAKNPAFTRYNRENGTIYMCTEFCEKNGTCECVRI